MNIFKAINFADEIDFSKVNSRGRELYFSGTQNSFWNVEKHLNRDTAKSKRERFNQIIEQNKVDDNKAMILYAINDKIKILMCD